MGIDTSAHGSTHVRRSVTFHEDVEVTCGAASLEPSVHASPAARSDPREHTPGAGSAAADSHVWLALPATPVGSERTPSQSAVAAAAAAAAARRHNMQQSASSSLQGLTLAPLQQATAVHPPSPTVKPGLQGTGSLGVRAAGGQLGAAAAMQAGQHSGAGTPPGTPASAAQPGAGHSAGARTLALAAASADAAASPFATSSPNAAPAAQQGPLRSSPLVRVSAKKPMPTIGSRLIDTGIRSWPSGEGEHGSGCRLEVALHGSAA